MTVLSPKICFYQRNNRNLGHSDELQQNFHLIASYHSIEKII